MYHPVRILYSGSYLTKSHVLSQVLPEGYQGIDLVASAGCFISRFISRVFLVDPFEMVTLAVIPGIYYRV